MFLKDKKDDFEIELPSIDNETDDCDTTCNADELMIIPIEKYDYLMTEVGKMDALRTYLINAKKPTFAAVEALLGISFEGRKHD